MVNYLCKDSADPLYRISLRGCHLLWVTPYIISLYSHSETPTEPLQHHHQCEYLEVPDIHLLHWLWDILFFLGCGTVHAHHVEVLWFLFREMHWSQTVDKWPKLNARPGQLSFHNLTFIVLCKHSFFMMRNFYFTWSSCFPNASYTTARAFLL